MRKNLFKLVESFQKLAYFGYQQETPQARPNLDFAGNINNFVTDAKRLLALVSHDDRMQECVAGCQELVTFANSIKSKSVEYGLKENYVHQLGKQLSSKIKAVRNTLETSGLVDEISRSMNVSAVLSHLDYLQMIASGFSRFGNIGTSTPTKRFPNEPQEETPPGRLDMAYPQEQPTTEYDEPSYPGDMKQDTYKGPLPEDQWLNLNK